MALNDQLHNAGRGSTDGKIWHQLGRNPGRVHQAPTAEQGDEEEDPVRTCCSRFDRIKTIVVLIPRSDRVSPAIPGILFVLPVMAVPAGPSD